MSDEVKIALITAIATAIPIVLTQVIGFLSQQKKLSEIHIQTNSNFDAQKQEIKTLNERINLLIQERGEAQGRSESK